MKGSVIHLFLVSVGILVTTFGSAQVLDPNESPLDGVYSKSIDNPNRKPIPYVHLRESDIMWMKRIWRIVDMREKMNHVFYYPEMPDQGRKNLMTVLFESIEETGNITPYDGYAEDGITRTDMFTIPLSGEEAMKKLCTEQTEQVYDPILDQEVDTTFMECLTARDITQFMIKEEVFFDKQRSVMETRILGIAPMVPQKGPNGEILELIPMFWIYFPEARRVFAQAEVYNRQNDVHRLTFDDVFWKRMFASRIIKETNVYNRSIQDYKAPMDALLEAERIKEDIRNREHDLWHF
jgi:gliding motility associated protien GldN